MVPGSCDSMEMPCAAPLRECTYEERVHFEHLGVVGGGVGVFGKWVRAGARADAVCSRPTHMTQTGMC